MNTCDGVAGSDPCVNHIGSLDWHYRKLSNPDCDRAQVLDSTGRRPGLKPRLVLNVSSLGGRPMAAKRRDL